MKKKWYDLEEKDLFQLLSTSLYGLNSLEAEKRIHSYGFNQLNEEKKTSVFFVFFRQFLNPLVAILLLALVVKLFSQTYVDGLVLLVTILLMAFIGFIQEIKAEHAIQTLKNLSSHQSKVKRDGKIELIDSKFLVPGDLIYLEIGDRIASDARLIEVKNLKVDESMFTGESMAIEKSIQPIAGECALADRKNMVFSGSLVKYGKALAIITETGMNTELGKIADTLGQIQQEKTPLQKDVHQLGIKMIISILIALLIFSSISFSYGMNIKDIFFLAVAAAVSAIPEALPAVFTITLAAGMFQMAKKNAIIRRLVAVETLGTTTIICSDKTGTLTMNRLSVVKLATCESEMDFKQSHPDLQDNSSYIKMLEYAALCNDAFFCDNQTTKEFIGDPLEVALLQATELIFLEKNELEKKYPRLKEIPFTSEKAMMATLHGLNHKKKLIVVKGAPEKILSLSKFMYSTHGIENLEQHHLLKIQKRMEEMSLQTLRLIAVGYLETEKEIDQFQESDFEDQLIFLGWLALMDPPREGVKEAIEKCKQAGIRTVMITGDHPQTALAIAKEIGIESRGVINGQELKKMNEIELDEKISQISIFARIEPLQKLQIVNAFQKRGEIIAMTGDGINDAPALEAANIGVAMGKKGTDVAKEVSDMVIADDHFDSIVDAIEEGRAIFSRLRNVTTFLVTTCFGELFGLILTVLFLGVPPLTSIQILWINLVTGSLIAIPLGFEPKTGLEMRSLPRSSKSALLYRGMCYRIGYLAFLLGLSVFMTFNFTTAYFDPIKAKTVVLTAVVVFEWLIALHMRTEELPLRKVGSFANKNLTISLSVAVLLHLSILYVPLLNGFFKTMPLSLSEWAIALIPGVSIYCIESFRKEKFPKLFSNGNGYKK